MLKSFTSYPSGPQDGIDEFGRGQFALPAVPEGGPLPWHALHHGHRRGRGAGDQSITRRSRSSKSHSSFPFQATLLNFYIIAHFRGYTHHVSGETNGACR